MNNHKGLIVAITNQKGGVGKTTTAMNLATALAACGEKILVVDFDPQGNATTGLGVEKVGHSQNVYAMLMGDCTGEQAIHKTIVPGLDIVPSTVHLSGAEIELVPAFSREYKLREALEPLKAHYDYIFIDCPPSLGLLTINALTAANRYLVPLQAEFFALEGVSQLLSSVNLVKGRLNTELESMGVLMTMVDTRNNLSKQVEQEVRNYFGEDVFETVIPRNVRVSEAPSHGRPVILYDTFCTGSRAYMSLAAELMRKQKTQDAKTMVSTKDEGMVA